ncbi:YeiH family protein [Rhodococcus sp. NPDC060086]|uniref:YeiH family protein n=1 Tax=Rhodococcus sp. NPDC060086 TaxID=3347055 RepID=UPI0036593E52
MPTSTVAAPPSESPSRLSVRATAATALAPGLALCAAATAAAMGINALLPAVSPLLIAIVLGAVVANVVDLPQRVRPGLAFSAKRLLRVGIALLGLQLLLADVLGLGWKVIVVVVAVVALGISGTMFLGGLLGLTWTQRVLIACGFSICGAAAVAAVDGVVDAKEEEVLTAVALVVVFGTLMIPAVPLLSQLLGLSDEAAGVWAGGSIHEVAQVVAAGGVIGGAALGVAAVTKLARVLMLAPVIAILGVRRRLTETDADAHRPPLVPLFVAVFLVCVAVRATGLVPNVALDVASVVQTALLTAAMFALGAGVHVATIKKVGARPFVLAAISTVWVASIALAGVLLAGVGS